VSLQLDWCSHKAAKLACTRWHYSRSVPTPPLVKIGVWEDERFNGCVLFGRGTTGNLGQRFGLGQTEACELVRIALRQHQAPVTRIVSIALRLLKQASPGLRCVISFADPNQGHEGRIYQAGNWVYTGATGGSVEYVDTVGRRWHSRQVSNRGWNIQYGERRLVTRTDACRRVRLLGKHRYVMPLDRAMCEQLKAHAQPYPIRAPEAQVAVCSPHQARGGGAAPTPALSLT